MILITGSTGYLGFKVTQKLLNEKRIPATDLILWLHAKNNDEFTAKQVSLLQRLGPIATGIKFAEGSLQSETPFASVDASKIHTIIHSAALTAFNIDEQAANSVNIEGSRKVFDFASRCENLVNLVQVSTLYASGMKTGSIAEEFLDSTPGFANHYERSKWTAETILRDQYHQLPWQILRVATILCDDDDGNVIQQNAVHNTLKLFYYGLISLLPGREETPLYLITGEFAANAVVHCATDETSRHSIFGSIRISPRFFDLILPQRIV